MRLCTLSSLLLVAGCSGPATLATEPHDGPCYNWNNEEILCHWDEPWPPLPECNYVDTLRERQVEINGFTFTALIDPLIPRPVEDAFLEEMVWYAASLVDPEWPEFIAETTIVLVHESNWYEDTTPCSGEGSPDDDKATNLQGCAGHGQRDYVWVVYRTGYSLFCQMMPTLVHEFTHIWLGPGRGHEDLEFWGDPEDHPYEYAPGHNSGLVYDWGREARPYCRDVIAEYACD